MSEHKTTDAQRATQKRYDDRNREKIRERKRAKREEVRAFIESYRREAGCVDCGTHEGRLEFDHRDPYVKNFEIGRVTARSIDAVKAEIALCDVRCASCHRRRHRWVPSCLTASAERN